MHGYLEWPSLSKVYILLNVKLGCTILVTLLLHFPMSWTIYVILSCLSVQEEKNRCPVLEGLGFRDSLSPIQKEFQMERPSPGNY